MHYANFSSNGKVTPEGINYTLVELVDGETEFNLIQLPFIGFEKTDFMTLPTGGLTLLTHFDMVIIDDKLFIVKSRKNSYQVLLMFSIPWHDDGFVGDIGEGPVPDETYKLKTGHFSQCFYHDYLFVLTFGVKYRFGYCSEKDLIFLKYEIYCDSNSNEISIRIISPGDERF